LGLDAIYYSAPMPRDLASLTILGAVFDKVYFPGVYLPKDGYDQAALDKEIERIRNLGSRLADELTAEGDHRAALKRSGLFYLLNLERFQRERGGS
jgi:hypothetical protein